MNFLDQAICESLSYSLLGSTQDLVYTLLLLKKPKKTKKKKQKKKNRKNNNNKKHAKT